MLCVSARCANKNKNLANTRVRNLLWVIKGQHNEGYVSVCVSLTGGCLSNITIMPAQRFKYRQQCSNCLSRRVVDVAETAAGSAAQGNVC